MKTAETYYVNIILGDESYYWQTKDAALIEFMRDATRKKAEESGFCLVSEQRRRTPGRFMTHYSYIYKRR